MCVFVELNDDRLDVSMNKCHCLVVAATYNLIQQVKRMLRDQRVNPASNDSEALKVAARKGHSEIVKLLLDDGRVNVFAGLVFISL